MFFRNNFFIIMSEIKPDGLPPVSMKSLMEAYKRDDAENGYGTKAKLARDFFGEVFDGIRLKLDDIFDQLAAEGETPHYTYFCEPDGEMTNHAIPIHMLEAPSFVSVVMDETPTVDHTTSPIFLLTTVKAQDFTPIILDDLTPHDLTPIVATDAEALFFQTPVILPPVVPKGHSFEFEKSDEWLPILATYGTTR